MIVGLTGGIGSGKTTVGLIFKHLGIPVYEADIESKKLLDQPGELQQKLVMLLGKEILKDGKIDRPVMAQKIFNDKELLKASNALIHPAVAENFQQWIKAQKALYVIREAAILFESGSYKDCDRIVVVSAPEELRIERVMKRSGASRKEIVQRIRNQWPESKKLARADYVIENDNQHSLIKQVIDVHQDIISAANTSG